jgi:hypothetical protein
MINKLIKYFEFQMSVMDRIGRGEHGAKNLIFHQCVGAADFTAMHGEADPAEVYTLWDEWRKKLEAKVWE